MNKNKKAVIHGFIVMIVVFIIALLTFVTLMPVAEPFMESVSNSNTDSLTKFLFLGIPFFLFFGIVGGIFLSG